MMKSESFKQQLNEEIARNNTLRQLTREESDCLKRTLIGMYDDIEKVCKTNNITIMLAGGSALGAIRHKGFIPWDDDLDLMMTRSDYKQFERLFEKELGQKYLLCAPNYSRNAKARFPKIILKNSVYKEITDCRGDYPSGLFLDVFILDSIPENKIIRLIKGSWCSMLMFLSTCAYWYEQRNRTMLDLVGDNSKAEKNLMIRLRIGKICSKLRSPSKWFDWVDKAVQYQGKSGLLGLPTGRKHYFGEIFEREVFLPAAAGIFEGENVLIPHDSNAYLKNLYGDYMQIPPEEKRERHFVIELQL